MTLQMLMKEQIQIKQNWQSSVKHICKKHKKVLFSYYIIAYFISLSLKTWNNGGDCYHQLSMLFKL